MKKQLQFQEKHIKKISKIAFILALFFSFNSAFGQDEITINKYAVKNATSCNQFDVTLEITGNPPTQPQEVVLIIDVSGSMIRGNDPTPIDYAKDAAKAFVNEFFLPTNNTTGKNKISIVTFDRTASIKLQLTDASNNGQALAISAIDDINITDINARTNTEDAIVKADQELTDHGTFDCATNRSIILLSDGAASTKNNGAVSDNCYTDIANTSCQTEAIQAGLDAQTTMVLGETYNQNIFTIGLVGAISGNEQANALNTLNGIQNAGAYSTENNADLSGIYSQILGKLVAAATQLPGQALVTDNIASGFSIVPGSITTTKGNATPSGQILSWFVPSVNKETISLTYSIQATDSNICGNQDNYGESIINYKDSNCNTTADTFVNPTICVPCPEIDPVIDRTACNAIEYSTTLDSGDCGASTSDSFAWEFFLNGNSIGTSTSQNGTFIYNGSAAFEGDFTASLTYIGQYGTCTQPQVTETANTIVLPTNLSASISSQTNNNCEADSLGEIVVVASNGTAPYSYSINGGTSQDTGVFTNLSQGTYDIEVTDSFGCTFIINDINIDAIDDESPVIICPATINVNADLDACEATNVTIKDPTATDNCATTFTFTGTRSDNLQLTDPYPIGITTITWSANDGTNDSDTCTQQVIVSDTEAPVFVEALPDDITVECDAVPVAETLTATDNCGIVNVTFNEVRVDAGCTYTLERTWTATDNAGLTTSHTQTITVQDTKAPTFVGALPGNITVECDAVPAAQTITATDDCGTATVSVNDVKINGDCPNNYIIMRTWTATDHCGLRTSHTQVITVQDTKAPTVSTPYEEVLNVSCTDIPDAPALQFTDNCSVNVTVDYEDTNSFAENVYQDYQIIRTWKVTDECGNSNTFTQTLNVALDEVVSQITAEDRCFDDGIVDLNTYLSTTNLNGTWELIQGNPVATLTNNLFDPTTLELTSDFLPDDGGIDYVFRYTTTENGCISVTELTMNINADCKVLPCGENDVEISKALTPNGDGYNETFDILGIDLCGFTANVKIFNRWGALIYESDNYEVGPSMGGFTGRAKSSVGSADKVPNGTYYYIVVLKNSGLKPFTGPLYIGTK